MVDRRAVSSSPANVARYSGWFCRQAAGQAVPLRFEDWRQAAGGQCAASLSRQSRRCTAAILVFLWQQGGAPQPHQPAAQHSRLARSRQRRQSCCLAPLSIGTEHVEAIDASGAHALLTDLVDLYCRVKWEVAANLNWRGAVIRAFSKPVSPSTPLPSPHQARAAALLHSTFWWVRSTAPAGPSGDLFLAPEAAVLAGVRSHYERG